MLYREYKTLDLPAIDRGILSFWDEQDIFGKSITNRNGNKPFIFYEGPPSANGMPGIHHVLSRTIKDIFCRYKTLQGFRVDRKGGWDTHGLPVELAVEKKLGITKEDIGVKISIADYNKECRSEVLKYKDVWDDITRKMGYWVDLKDPYVTFENDYIETVWWLLKELYKKGYLYKGLTIQPFSPAAGTGLSSHELNYAGAYRMVKDTSVTAQFKVVRDEQSEFLFDDKDEEVFFLAWTTTPWTLPSNTALAVGKKIKYKKIKTENPYTKNKVSVILAEEAKTKYFSQEGPPVLMEGNSFTGKQFDGIYYEQLLPYVKPTGGDAFKVIIGDFVSTEDGTGIVHIAPSFGSDDMRMAKKYGLAALTLVDKKGRFVKEVTDFAEVPVKNYDDDPNYESVDIQIAVKLKKENRAFKVEKYEHNYPHCWRTDKPVIYYPLDSWFIKTTAVKERLVELNNTINWQPPFTGSGRFGNWLENLVDWNLSRSRYWGTPLPIWKTESPQTPKGGLKADSNEKTEEICIGSIEELKNEIEKSIKAGFMNASPLGGGLEGASIDLHKPFVDEIVLVSPSGKRMTREPDLIDVWFDSGAMPYAQWHFPFSLPPASSKGGGGKWQTARTASYNLLKELKEERLKNQTEAEAILWDLLRAKQLDGFKFRRQHVIDEFIVDFVCLSKKIIVEVDGKYHLTQKQQQADKLRTEILEGMGYTVIRFPNEQVTNAPETVLQGVKTALARLPALPLGEGLGGAFPADFISEGVDQTRGWFFTLHTIAVLLFDSVAFKNVLSNGLLLDKEGNKMSKRLGNTIDPFQTIAKYGADATRWYMMSNSDPWDNLKFDFDGVTEIQRKLFGTLFNTYSFFALYANIDGFEVDKKSAVPLAKRSELDRWIISKLHSMVKFVNERMNDYDPTPAVRAVEEFVNDHLSNWYIRLSRRRFWRGELNEDKKAAYHTLYECLTVTIQLMSPVAPFFSDWMYRNLTDSNRKGAMKDSTVLESIHLTDLVLPDEKVIDSQLEKQMDYAQRISSLVLSLRKKVNIKVRQPLSKILLPVLNKDFKEDVGHVEKLILSEVNVKELEYIHDTEGMIKKKAKADFKKLGSKLGPRMKQAAQLIAGFSQEDISTLEKQGRMDLDLNGEKIVLLLEEVEIISEDIPGWQVASKGELTVALDVSITEKLKEEGHAREFVNRIQNLRKDRAFNVTDRIKLEVEKHIEINSALTNFKDYICAEILAEELAVVDSITGGSPIEVNEIPLMVNIKKAELWQ